MRVAAITSGMAFVTMLCAFINFFPGRSIVARLALSRQTVRLKHSRNKALPIGLPKPNRYPCDANLTIFADTTNNSGYTINAIERTLG
jgi:hypothetical protein